MSMSMNLIPLRIAVMAALLVCVPLAATGCARSPETSPVADTGTDAIPPPAPEPAAPVEDPDLARAKAAAMAFSGQLRSELQAAMAAGGPVAAVEVCHQQAPRIADEVMVEHGVRLGRVALPGRHRNPVQAAADWRLATLQAFQQAVDGGAAAAEQVAVVHNGLPDGVALRMMRGIATEPGCLACHGSDIAPEIHQALHARYPDDGATGFAVGDLRGALWVEAPTVDAEDEVR